MRALFLIPLLLGGCAENPADSKPTAVVSSATAAPAGGQIAGVKYAITPDTSKVEFVGSKVTGSHSGGFTQFKGEIGVVDNNPEKSAVKIDIDTTSVFADDAKLTDHLKTGDFFEVDKFPQASFASTAIKKEGDKFTMSGDLTMHGVTKQISFPAEITVAPDKVTAKSEFSINRMDFGIVYKGKADNLIRPDGTCHQA